MRKKTASKYGSMITGIILGYLVGFILTMILPEFLHSNILFFGLPMSFFAYLSLKKPRFIEYLAYAVAILIFVNFGWDYVVGDRNNIRMSLFIGSMISLIVNIFTGQVKLVGAKKTLKKALGL